MKETGTPEASDIPILFRYYPELIKKIPWTPLGNFPTQIQPLTGLGYENLWIKRDDLSCRIYGGNKIRKLEFILAEARRRKTGRLITFGGIGTNHGLATAIFCNRLNIACTLLLFWQPVTREVKQNLLLFKKYRANLRYSKTIWGTVIAYYLLERLKHPGAYFLYAGGSNPVGTIGFINAAFELKEHIESGEIPQPAIIMCPLGSGGTLCGLSLGLQLAGLATEVIGVRVTESHLGPFHACTPKTVKTLMYKTYRFLKQQFRGIPDISLNTPRILDEYFGDGYGLPTEAGKKAYQMVIDNTDLKLDPTYTAKTVAAVLDYCQAQQKRSEPVLYWHTYNSVDLSKQANSVDYRDLPKTLQKFIEQEPLTL
ncbi:MAG: pyridoxal-phosphate dependent enzyme [Desulfobacterales bacterium]|jgi:D-cysteine desulfhydrase